MTTHNAGTGSRYWSMWRGLPRELGFLLLTLPIALVGFALTITAFSAGVGTLLTVFIGLVLLIGGLYASRGFGTLELVRLGWAGQPRVTRPEWQDAAARQGFWGWLRSVLGNGHYWLYLLHTMIVNFAVSLISWTVTVIWLTVSLGGLTFWLWDGTLSDGAREENVGYWVVSLFGGSTAGDGGRIVDAIVCILLGLIALATLPLVTRGLVLLHHLIAKGMLGAFRSDALQREVLDLSASRGAAASAEGHSLRRLERDIHDGPQQRLVRLHMDLSAADRQLDADPARARVLIGEAMLQAKEALEELRALSRGFAPPILLDRGLVAALQSVAVRNPVPTRVVDELPAAFVLPQEIERNAYFIASEALVNATKHSGASDIELRVALHRIPDGDATWLDVAVTDNGSGGAVAVDGHGLAGLEERLRGLGGVIEVASPVGGPTVITAHLPVTTAMTSSI